MPAFQASDESSILSARTNTIITAYTYFALYETKNFA